MAITNVTWDTVNKGSLVVLSNNNLTASKTDANNRVRASLGKTTGKWYWEIKLDIGVYAMVGIVNKLASLTSNDFTNNTRFYYYGSTKYPEGTAYGTTITTGDIVSVLLDLDNGTLEFWKNGVSQGISHTNIKSMGEVFPAVNSGSTNGFVTATANFGGTPFAYPIPSGYMAYANYPLNKILISLNDGSLLNVTNEKYLSDNMLPIMTSNTSSIGKAIASVNLTDAYKISNNVNTATNGTDAWSCTNNGWVGFEFDKVTPVGSYSIVSSGAVVGYTPKNWTFEGSNDGVNWILLDKRINETVWSVNQEKKFLILNPKPFKMYRVSVDGNNGATNGSVIVGELKLFGYIESSISVLNNAVEQNFINYGMNKSEELDFSSQINKKVFIEQSPTTLGSGKVFKKTIDTSALPIKKVSIK